MPKNVTPIMPLITAVPNGTGVLVGAAATVKAGVATFTGLADDTAESIAFSFHANGLASSPTNPITVNPAPVDHFLVSSNFASPDVAGTTGTVTVAAMDRYNNPVDRGPNRYEGTVDLATTDNQAAGLTVSGVVTGSAGLTKQGSGVLDLSGANTYTGTTTVSAGAPLLTSQPTVPPSVSVGAPLPPGTVGKSIQPTCSSGNPFLSAAIACCWL